MYAYASKEHSERTIINTRADPFLDRSKLTDKERKELAEHEAKERMENYKRSKESWERDHQLVEKLFPGDAGPPTSWYPCDFNDLPFTDSKTAESWMYSKYPELRHASYKAKVYVYYQHDIKKQYEERQNLLHELFVAGSNIIDAERSPSKELKKKFTNMFDDLFMKIKPDTEERAVLKEDFRRFRNMRELELRARESPSHAPGCWCAPCRAREEL